MRSRESQDQVDVVSAAAVVVVVFFGRQKTTRNKNKSVITFLVRNYAAPCNEIESVRALSPMTRSRAATQAMPAVLKLKVK